VENSTPGKIAAASASGSGKQISKTTVATSSHPGYIAVFGQRDLYHHGRSTPSRRNVELTAKFMPPYPSPGCRCQRAPQSCLIRIGCRAQRLKTLNNRLHLRHSFQGILTILQLQAMYLFERKVDTRSVYSNYLPQNLLLAERPLV